MSKHPCEEVVILYALAADQATEAKEHSWIASVLYGGWLLAAVLWGMVTSPLVALLLCLVFPVIFVSMGAKAKQTYRKAVAAEESAGPSSLWTPDERERFAGCAAAVAKATGAEVLVSVDSSSTPTTPPPSVAFSRPSQPRHRPGA